MSADDNFLSRWSRRKHLAKREAPPPEPPPPESAAAATAQSAAPAPAPEITRPLPPVESLTPDSDFAPFMQAGVDGDVKRGALKKLFADPRFNVMDGLDVYIDDYSKPDPLPEGWLEKMNQVKHLGIFREEPAPQAPAEAESQRETASMPPAQEPPALDSPQASESDPLPASQVDKDPTSRN